mmetsp:Transcript_22901/g.41549  ORF Transcript_22901/g.41549 Transcript_22901/m.41549 type:complete len:594 (-) Transcript_22901:722-2503(-)
MNPTKTQEGLQGRPSKYPGVVYQQQYPPRGTFISKSIAKAFKTIVALLVSHASSLTTFYPPHLIKQIPSQQQKPANLRQKCCLSYAFISLHLYEATGVGLHQDLVHVCLAALEVLHRRQQGAPAAALNASHRCRSRSPLTCKSLAVIATLRQQNKGACVMLVMLLIATSKHCPAAIECFLDTSACTQSGEEITRKQPATFVPYFTITANTHYMSHACIYKVSAECQRMTGVDNDKADCLPLLPLQEKALDVSGPNDMGLAMWVLQEKELLLRHRAMQRQVKDLAVSRSNEASHILRCCTSCNNLATAAANDLQLVTHFQCRDCTQGAEDELQEMCGTQSVQIHLRPQVSNYICRRATSHELLYTGYGHPHQCIPWPNHTLHMLLLSIPIGNEAPRWHAAHHRRARRLKFQGLCDSRRHAASLSEEVARKVDHYRSFQAERRGEQHVAPHGRTQACMHGKFFWSCCRILFLQSTGRNDIISFLAKSSRAPAPCFVSRWCQCTLHLLGWHCQGWQCPSSAVSALFFGGLGYLLRGHWARLWPGRAEDLALLSYPIQPRAESSWQSGRSETLSLPRLQWALLYAWQSPLPLLLLLL